MPNHLVFRMKTLITVCQSLHTASNPTTPLGHDLLTAHGTLDPTDFR